MVAYIWPVPQRPTFAWGRYPSGGYHPAYDLPSPTGTAVHAPASGTVIEAGWDTTGYGLHVRIRHATGHISILAHNQSLLVVPGQYVKQGQQVSWSDSTGNSSGPHVHWETRTGPGLQRLTAYDPGPYIGAGAPFTGGGTQTPSTPTSATDPGGPVTPNQEWYGATAGTILLPQPETLVGVSGLVEVRFSPFQTSRA